MIDTVLSRLEGVRGGSNSWQARCPAHEDKRPSLAISVGQTGKVILKCFAGCDTERILDAMGMRFSDLFPEEHHTPIPTRPPKDTTSGQALARSYWQAGVPATTHPYLTKKGIRPHGMRVAGDTLLVPMRIGSELHNVQRINEGGKFFTKGARVNGTYFAIGRPTSHRVHQVTGRPIFRIWVCEGVATGASVHECTGDAVACAMNAGNIFHVTPYLLEKGFEIYVAADNDEAGRKAADQALDAGAAYAVWPVGRNGFDWNDFHASKGAEHMMEVMYGA